MDSDKLLRDALATIDKPEEVAPELASTEAPEPQAPEVKEEKAPVAPAVKEETIAEILKQEPKSEPKSVPEAAFLKEKSGRREAERALKALQESIQDGATKAEVTADISSIAEEFGVDASFLSKFAAAVKADAKREAKEEVDSELAPIREKERQDKIDAAFTKAYQSSIERNPEFDGIANPDVIKAMSLMPQNSEKTFSQLLEEAYGHTVTGKKTIETTKPGGGKEPAKVDVERAKTDEKYFDEVMADPVMKAQYNDDLARRLKL